MSLSEIRVNTTKTRTGVGTITYTETGPVITGIATASNFKTGSTNVHSTGVEVANINTSGSTATFGGAISGTTASFSGTVSIGGTLTYEDVTNIDSVGILTARAGIKVTGGNLEIGSSVGRFDSSGIIKTAHGTESAPSHTFINDPDNGMYRPTTNTLGFVCGGDEKLRITSGGLVGINETSPVARLHIQGSADAPCLVLPDTTNTRYSVGFGNINVSGVGQRLDFYAGDSGNNSNNLTSAHRRMSLTSQGRLGIGLISPESLLHVSKLNGAAEIILTSSTQPRLMLKTTGTSAECRVDFGDSGDSSRGAIGYNHTDDALKFYTSGVANERLRITSTGKVSIGDAATHSLSAHSEGDDLVIGGAGWRGMTIYGEGGGGVIQFADNGDNRRGQIMYNHGDDSMMFRTGGNADRLIISSDGIVETGTATGGSGYDGNQRLRVGRAGDCNIAIRNTANTTSHTGIDFGDSGDDRSGRIQYMHNGDYMSFHTNGAGSGTSNEKLRIDSSGRLRVASTTESADGAFDDLIVGNHSGNRGISILSQNGQQGALGFAKSGTLADGYVAYNHNSTATDSSMILKSSGLIQFNTSSVAAVIINKRKTIQLQSGNKLSISDGDYDNNFSGSYAGYHADNHGNQVIGINCHLNYNSQSGTHQWKQTNAHGSVGSAGIFIGGNGSDNNSDVCIFANNQGSSAGTVFAQDSWKLRIRSTEVRLNNNQQFTMTGYFKTRTNQQSATNCPAHATGMGYAYGYQEAYSTTGGGWSSPYPNLVLGYHTGVVFGAHQSYQGCRFYTDHPSSSSSLVLSIGNNNNGVHVTNTLSKGGGSFRIAHPHPTKKYTHDLQHSFIEGPQCDNIYRGKVTLVNGTASINIDTVSNMTDGTFVLLNRDIQCFTSNETGWDAVKGSVSGNVLTITSQNNSSTDIISWMVIGERQDDKIKSPDMDMTDSNGKLIVEPLTIEETHM